MEAKETVMTTDEICNLMNRNNYHPYYIQGAVVARTQAEITWDKAIREVVEWVELHPNVPFYRSEEWQTQKEKWGLK